MEDTKIVEVDGGSVPSVAMDKFREQYKLASFLSKSDILPNHFKGKESDCFIALEIANRTGASFLEVVQNLYVVRGTPSWKSTFVISQINRCHKFQKPLMFKKTGVGDQLVVQAYTYLDDQLLDSTVSMQMAIAEGWAAQNKKYKTMPEQMLMYRAAAFFCRTYCPEILFGMYTGDEIIDIESKET